MRISSISSIVSTSPVKPVHRVVRRKPSLNAQPVEAEPMNEPSVTTSVSEFGSERSKDDTVEEKAYKKRNPLWNTMLNL
jgi:hypothetical protein